MIERRSLSEWPLAVFTMALQIACGIAIATTIVSAYSPAPSAATRALSIAVFPLVAAGLAVSLLHLGRPLSAWRAFTNILHSKLSREVLLSAAFAVAAFAYSFASWTAAETSHHYAGALTSILGLAAVVASAAIYDLPAKTAWHSGWIMASFLGSILMIAGLAVAICTTPSRWGVTAVLSGGALLLLSGARLWSRLPRLHRSPALHTCFAGHLLLIVLVPLLAFIPGTGVPLAVCTAALGIFTGRMLMFAAAELEEPF